MKQTTKKIPIVRYLCYLLAISLLFSGISFARFSGFNSGDVTSPLSRFACSFEISDMSAATFSNVDYWLTIDGEQTAMNTARSIRFTVRNNTQFENGQVDRISDVDLQSTLRLYAPAEFASNLALQIVEIDKNGFYSVSSPQYVLSEFIYNDDGTFATLDRNVNTASFTDYDARTDGVPFDEVLAVQGGFTGTAQNHNGKITAYCSQTGNKLTISSQMRLTQYSVGFLRGKYIEGTEVAESSAPLLYLDCQAEIPYYTVDLQLSDMLLDADGSAMEKQFVLFLTVVKATNNSEFSMQWSDALEKVFEDPAPNSQPKTLYENGPQILGYHFDKQMPLHVFSDGQWTATGQNTTVRLQKTFDYQNGGSKITFSHVAPLLEGATAVAHPLTNFFDAHSTPWEDTLFENITDVHGLFAQCSSGLMTNHVSMADFPDNPHYDSYTNQIDGVADFNMGQALSKAYPTQINVLFIQADEQGG